MKAAITIIGKFDLTRILHGRVRFIDLPEDAIVLRAKDSLEYNGVELLLQSWEFKDVAEGNMIPHINFSLEVTPE